MQPILGLNTLDLLLLVILFVGILAGFVRGAISQIVSVVSIWLGLVVTLWLYKPLSDRILQPDVSGFGMAKTPADVISFLILLLVFFNGFRLLVKYLAVPPEEKKKKKRKRGTVGPPEDVTPSAYQRFIGGPLNAVGGLAMGFILTTIWLALLLGVIQFIFQPTGTDVPYSGFAGGLVRNLRTSGLLPIFNQVLFIIVQSVTLFVPRNADILKGVLEIIV
ncbi:MAG: CvpA family protein [Anaerolineales bacterium]|nr:CvpA family protein [Anaerolineales bacterium]